MRISADPGGIQAGSSAFTAVGDELVGLGVAAAAALEAMAGAAGDGGLAGVLAEAAASANASLDEVAKHAHAYGPALTATANNYETSDQRSARGFRVR